MKGVPMMRLSVWSTHSLHIGALLILMFPRDSLQGKYQKLLLRYLFDDQEYDPLERPVIHENETVTVRFNITLQQIIDVDEKNQILLSNVWLIMDEKNQIFHTNAWLSMEWVDPKLSWDPKEFGAIKVLQMPSDRVWTPDILMYNSADERFDGTYHCNVVINYDGVIFWVPPGMFKSTCKIDILWFPFDEQKCKLDFGSWTHPLTQVNLTNQGRSNADDSAFIQNGEWNLIGLTLKYTKVGYECCEDQQYAHVEAYVIIRRRTLYYGFNIILPCVLISTMSLLTFILPPDSGEKISLGVTIMLSLMLFLLLVAETMPPTSDALPLIGVTIMLSLMVFLLLIAETMPPTSDALPLIGIYFSIIMVMCSLSVVFTVLVLNCHHRGPDTHTMPKWVDKIICQWLAWILMMRRPGKEPPRKRILQNSKLRDLEMKTPTSRSLLENVMDGDEDIPIALQSNSSSCHVAHSAYGHSHRNVRMEDGFMNSSSMPMTQKSELLLILKEIRKMTSKLKKEDDEDEVRGDWKFAALVVDRLCLIMFTLFTVVSTFGILFSAPHLVA